MFQLDFITVLLVETTKMLTFVQLFTTCFFVFSLYQGRDPINHKSQIMVLMTLSFAITLQPKTKTSNMIKPLPFFPSYGKTCIFSKVRRTAILVGFQFGIHSVSMSLKIGNLLGTILEAFS